MNRVITRRDQRRKHLTKVKLFDIQSLADELYHSRSTIFKKLLNRLKKGIKQPYILVQKFNQSLQRIEFEDFSGAISSKDIAIEASANRLIESDIGGNKKVNEFFFNCMNKISSQLKFDRY